LISHADGGVSPTFAVVLLTIQVVGLAIPGLLVFAIRLTPLLPACHLAAPITAIAVATIATTADEENGPTIKGNAEALAENHARVLPAHPHPIADWTSAPPS
jgi:hypothetical protein